MRPKLKPDVYWAPVPEGLFLASSAGQRIFPGTTLHQWLDRISPFLDGSHTLDELSQGLRQEQRTMLCDLVHALAGAGYVKDVTEDRPHSLSSDELRKYADEIAVIDYYRDSAAHRFERYRNSRLVLVGAGLTLACLVHAALRTGPRHVVVAVTNECETNLERVNEYARLAKAHDSAQEFAMVTVGAGDAAYETILDGADLALHVSDRAVPDRMLALERLCQARDIQLAQALLLGEDAWLGPLGEGTWHSAWYRLLANEPAPPLEPPQYVAGPTASLVANHLVFSCFRQVTGIEPDDAPRGLVQINLETLQTVRRRVIPHPADPLGRAVAPQSEEEFLATIEERRRRKRLEESSFSELATALFDERLGVFTSLDEREFTQLPLHIAQVVVSDPVNLLGPGARRLVATGVGQDFGTARRRATRTACEVYGALMMCRRRLLPPEDSKKRHPNAGRLWAYALRAGGTRLVDATIAFPVLQGGVVTSISAVGSGLDWEDAVSRALLGACARLVAAGAATSGGPWPALEMDALSLCGAGARYRSMLRAGRIPHAVHDLSAIAGVPAFAFLSGGQTVAYSAGFTVDDALARGLEQVVLHHQSQVNGEPEYAPQPVPELHATLWGGYGTNQVISPVDGLNGLIDVLAERGYEPLVIPLDHDPALAAVSPHTVRAVLADA